MSDPPSQAVPDDLDARLAQLGAALGTREAEHRAGLEAARACVAELRERVKRAVERFERAAADAGAPHLRVQVSEPRIDDKHIRAFEFELTRGRHRAIVTARSRGDVTLVGPFHAGKTEGPCLTFPMDAASELEAALGGFLTRFLEEAITP